MCGSAIPLAPGSRRASGRSVVDGPPGGESSWDPIVAFSGPAAEVEAWIRENFPSGIESRAYKDDMQVAVERLGEGVQMKGDRLTHGVHDPISFVVVVGQQEEPTVHVAMWSAVR